MNKSETEDGVMQAAKEAAKFDNGVSASSVYRAQKEARTVWPRWEREDIEFLREAGPLFALKETRDKLIETYPDARILLGRAESYGLPIYPNPELFLIWDNHQKPSGDWYFRKISVGPVRNATQIVGVRFKGSWPGKESKTRIAKNELTPETMGNAIKKALADPDFFRGYAPQNPLRWRRLHQIGRMTIK